MLLNESDRITSDDWIAQFKDQILRPLDEAAEGKIRQVSKSIGIQTAISPYPLVDACVVIYSSFNMLTQLCRIYNLRLDALTLLRLAGRAFTQAFIAGSLEQLPVEDWLTDTVNSALLPLGRIKIPYVGSLLAPGIQGVANGVMISRLGRSAQRMLRPIKGD